MSSAPSAAVASASVVYPPFRIQARMVGLMFALSAMNYFDRVVMSIAGPGIMKDFRISETGMGTIYSAFLLSYTLMMTPHGALADRFGGRRALTIAGLGAALLTGLAAGSCPRGAGANRAGI